MDKNHRQMLNSSLIAAVNKELSVRSVSSSPPFQTIVTQEKADPVQIAMAVAYTRLYMEEPEMVTGSHLRLLRKYFSFEQIQELTSYIKKKICIL